jgi:hypothetical protein
MKTSILLLGFLALAGCASEPMTDEQRQFAMQYLLARANQPPPQPYMLPAPAPVQPIQQPIQSPRTCQSYVNGQYINTTCY